jgi:hypothetical protein
MSLLDEEINAILNQQAEKTRQALLSILGGQAGEMIALKKSLERHNGFETPRVVGARYGRDITQSIPPLSVQPILWTSKIADTSITPMFRGSRKVFSGVGLDDMIVAGQYSGSANPTYTVTVAGTGTPNTFNWNDGLGGSGAGVSMSTSLITLNNGVKIYFGATTGHTIGNSWTWKEPLGRLYANSDGYYMAGFSLAIKSVVATYRAELLLMMNGTNFVTDDDAVEVSGSDFHITQSTGMIPMVAGDYLETIVYHTNANPVTVADWTTTGWRFCSMWMCKM